VRSPSLDARYLSLILTLDVPIFLLCVLTPAIELLIDL